MPRVLTEGVDRVRRGGHGCAPVPLRVLRAKKNVVQKQMCPVSQQGTGVGGHPAPTAAAAAGEHPGPARGGSGVDWVLKVMVGMRPRAFCAVTVYGAVVSWWCDPWRPGPGPGQGGLGAARCGTSLRPPN